MNQMNRKDRKILSGDLQNVMRTADKVRKKYRGDHLVTDGLEMLNVAVSDILLAVESHDNSHGRHLEDELKTNLSLLVKVWR